MKTEFDQKRADRDAILYNTDGRLFDVVETPEKLELVSRSPRSILLTWSIGLSIIPMLLTSHLLSSSPSWVQYAVMGGGIVLAPEVINQILTRITHSKGIHEAKRWMADKNSGQFCADAQEVAQLEEIIAVRAWKSRLRLRLALRLRGGHQVQIGLWKFANREWAWRHDAAQIAAFLGVPLEIPPI